MSRPTSPDIGTMVNVRIGREGETKLTGRLNAHWNGEGPVSITRMGKVTIIPEHRIAWVEEASS